MLFVNWKNKNMCMQLNLSFRAFYVIHYNYCAILSIGHVLVFYKYYIPAF